MKEQLATIEKVNNVAENTTEVVFKLSEGLYFIAGQYISVTLPTLSALDIREQFRDFSIASDPIDSKNVSIIFRNSESKFKKEILTKGVGLEVLISGPKGVFTLKEESNIPILFIAGGVGVTPFLSIIRNLKSTDNKIRPTLFYFNRSRESAVYLDELENSKEYVDLHAIMDKVEEKYFVDYFDKYSTKVSCYIAGPAAMTKSIREILSKLEVEDIYIKTEEFTGYE